MNTQNWMLENEALIKNKPLRELAIPGSHDTGTYKLHAPWDLDPNIKELEWSFFAPDKKEDERALYMAGTISEGWAQCQTRSVIEQLNDGIRYLDVRVAVDQNGDIRTVHAYYGPKMENIFEEVREFVNKNQNELVILGFNHFWDVKFQEKNDLPPGENKSEGLTNNHWEKLVGLMDEKLGDRFVPNSFSPTNTLEKLWEANGPADGHRNQVIAIFNIDIGEELGQFPENLVNENIWFEKEKACWTSKTEKNKFKEKTQQFIDEATDSENNNKYVGKFWGVKSCVTPSMDMYIYGNDPTGTYPANLKKLADDTNPVALGWVKNEWSKEPINLIWSDHYHKTDLVKLALYLNGIEVDFTGTDLGKKTNWGNWLTGAEIALEWCEEKGMQLVNWGEDAVNWAKEEGEDVVNDVAEWFGFDEPYKEKAEKPSNGNSPGTLAEGIRQYRVYLESIKVKDAGSEDVWPDDPDLELYHAINVIPTNAVVNEGANKYLWHKSEDQEVKIDEGKKKEYDTYKDVYTIESNPETAKIDLKINLKEEDGSSGDDEMKGEISVNPASFSVGQTKEYEKTVKSGSQKVKVKFKIRRKV